MQGNQEPSVVQTRMKESQVSLESANPWSVILSPFSAVTLLVGRQEGHPTCILVCLVCFACLFVDNSKDNWPIVLHSTHMSKGIQLPFYRSPECVTVILCSGETVERVATFKLLHVHVSKNLKWAQHIQAISAKGASRLHFLMQLKRAGAGTDDLLCFYCSVIHVQLWSTTAHFGIPAWLLPCHWHWNHFRKGP